jgi:DNA-binding PadR family transcriptional regulator
VKKNIKKEIGDNLIVLINEGMVEVSSVDEDGKFSYRLTEKGKKASKEIDIGEMK